MSLDTNTEISELKFVKPVKRVRFSDEVNNVYEFERDDDDDGNDDSGNEMFPMEDISYAKPSSIFTDDELHLEEQTDNSDDIDKETVVDSSVHSVPEISTSHDSALLKSTDLSDTNVLSNENDQLNENETIFNSNEGCSLVCDTENLGEISVNELITETNLLMISSAEICTEEKNFEFLEETSVLSLESKLQDSDLPVDVLSAEQKNITSEITRRSIEGSLSEKQTLKLNNYLQKNHTDINSADKLKDAVFKAWCEVKKKKTDVQNISCKTNARKNSVVSQKSSSHNAFEAWQKSKRRAKANTTKESKPTKQKTKEDLEESKMAFEAWKKKKDEFMQQQKVKKYKEKEKEKIDKLMKERMKKNAAESAYLAWSAHKVVVNKIEREKNQWFLEKEQEKISERKRRYDEAAKIYYDWLEDKVYATRKHNQRVSDDKPPWIPAGKANSVI